MGLCRMVLHPHIPGKQVISLVDEVAQSEESVALINVPFETESV